ncbi:hypothetical protein D3C78_1376690 [compost metagenome]
MLQGLELADCLAELLARLQVLKGKFTCRFHAAHRLGALRRQGTTVVIAQSGQCLADFTQRAVGTDKHVVEQQLAGLAAVHSWVSCSTHAWCPWIEQEHADAGFIALATAGACRHQDQPGAVACDHHRFTPVELPPAIHCFGACTYVVQLVVAGRLIDSNRHLQLAAGNLRQQFGALFDAAQGA